MKRVSIYGTKVKVQTCRYFEVSMRKMGGYVNNNFQSLPKENPKK
jgi:hypothetical protein